MTSCPGVVIESPSVISAPAGQYSHVATIAAGSELFYFAGQVGTKLNGELEQGFQAQVRRTFDNLFALLEFKGLTPANLVKLNYYLTDPEQAAELRQIRCDYLPDPAPATTALVVRLLDPAWLFEMDAVAARPLV